MSNYSNTSLPDIINAAFPSIKNMSYIRQLSSLTPLCPDTVFHIFADEKGKFYSLVATDHPDPYNQCEELKSISGEYGFEFIRLVKPYANNQCIEIREHDEMDGDFVVDDPHNDSCYYLTTIRRARN